MPKFFIPSNNVSDEQLIIEGGDVAHITRVLRLGEGDTVTACDSSGNDYEARIASASSDRLVCDIISKQKCASEPEIKVTLFQGLPKGSKMEYIIQKTTELGIHEIVPTKLSRCVSKVEGKKDETKKLDRWQKISESAAKQSGRGIIPEIKPFMTLDEIIDASKDFDLFFVPYECEDRHTMREVLLSKPDVKSVGFVIGPEGGFDITETEKLKNAHIPTVTLGKRILRTETAGEAVLAMIMYEIGDIN